VPYDIILAGLGAMGSATAFRLAGRGLRVLGLDRYHPPHSLGSTHGGSRVIRETAFEGPRYVPLARRAYAAWRRIEEATGTSLLHPTGVLFLGDPASPLIRGTLASARAHGVRHEEIPTPDLARRYPLFTDLGSAVGVLEPGGGWLDPEGAVRAMLGHAGTGGVELHWDEPLRSWRPDGEGIAVETPRGRYRTRRLMLAAGPWMPALLGPAGTAFSVERQVQHWFSPRGAGAPPPAFPVFIWQTADAVFYGLPPADGEVKVAVHHDGERTTPDTVRRAVDAREIAATRALLERHIPALAGPHRRAAVCLYTNSPDGHFVIDRHPESEAVIIVSACSGFGFKFASAIGEIAAGLLVGESPAVDLDLFRLKPPAA
jgi:sarcosine oxidase